MLVVITAQHLSVGRPLRERDCRAVNADESLAVIVHEADEVSLLLIVHFQRAAGIKDHRVEVVQAFRVVLQFRLGQRFGVRVNNGVPRSRLPPEPLNRDHRVGHRFMPVSLLLSNDKEALSSGRGPGPSLPRRQRRTARSVQAVRAKVMRHVSWMN